MIAHALLSINHCLDRISATGKEQETLGGGKKTTYMVSFSQKEHFRYGLK